MNFKHSKTLIYMLIMGAVITSAAVAQVLSSGQVDNPYKVAVSKGDLYSVDTSNNRIRKFDASGNLIYSYGSYGSSNGQFNQPQGIAADSSGYVYVVDTGNQRIQKLYDDGSLFTFVQSISNIPELNDQSLLFPRSIRVDNNGNIFIVDTAKNRVIKYSTGGVIGGGGGGISASSVGGSSSGIFNAPYGADVDGGGYIYIADTENHKIKKYSSGGNLLLEFGSQGQGRGQFLYPFDVAVDSVGNIYAADTGNHRIQKFDRFGKYAASFGGSFFAPRGVFVDESGYLYVVGADNKIQKIAVASPKDFRIVAAGTKLIVPSKKFTLKWEPFHGLKKYQIYTNRVEEGREEKRWGLLKDDINPEIDSASVTLPMEGVWELKVRAINEGDFWRDSDGANSAGKACDPNRVLTVVVDITPPRIENALVDNLYFSPNGDGRKDNTNLTFHLSDNICLENKVTVKLVDSSGAELATLMDRVILPNGETNFGWNGWVADRRVEDGEYKLMILAEDEAGNIGVSDPVIVVVDTTPPEIQGLTAAPNPFTPNDDGVKDTTAFTYTLSEPCYTNLKIFREDGVLFRGRGKYNVTEDSYTWDGKGARGELLGGAYSYYLYAEDRAANTSTSEAKTIIVDREPSLIPYCYAEPDPFSPVNPRNNYTEVKYWVSRNNVQVQAAVLGREGQIIKNLVFGETQNKGEHTARWVGDFVSGYDGPRSSRDSNRVADGAYEFKIWANDPYNDARGENNNTVLVDNTPPYVALYPVEVDQVRKKATLRYYLPENSKVDIAAYDAGGGLVERLITGETQDAGEYFMPWEIGSRPLGRTYFTVAAEDSAKNRDEKTTEIFSVNPEQVLTLADISAVPNPFTPNSDGLKDQTRITYRVSGGVPGYQVNINIFNSAGATVRRLVVNEPQNQGTYNFYWDGRADSSDPTVITYAPDGLYTYQIIAEDRLGGRVEAGGALTLVSTKPTVNVSVSPVNISPNGDGIADNALITYSIDYPTFWIDAPAQVKLDIVSASGEAVFTRTFTQTPGNYSYTWNVRDGGDYGTRTSDVPAGTYYVFANATDALGTNALPKSALFYVDYTVPAPSNFTMTPLYAKLGTRVLINLSFDEPLAENPDVKIVVSDLRVGQAQLESSSGNSYQYSYTISPDDPEGIATVRVEARDLSLNPIIRTQTFIIDKTNPVISSINFSPNPAKVGDAHIDFRVNEDLSSSVVKVAQNGTLWNYAPVSYLGGGNYRATHKVFSGYDGPATTTIEVADLAENLTTLLRPAGYGGQAYQPGLVIDTIAPTFSGISCEVNNLDFSKHAREGSEVAINFKSSEILQFNPDVRTNGRPAAYGSQLTAGGRTEYTYRYTVQNDDPEGLAEISISAYDPAGNLGEKTTSSASESFTTDLTNPTVAIAAPGSADIIASPSPFFTNADPTDTSDRPNYTTLRYETSEYGFVTLKVHRIRNDQIAYTRDSFTEDNRAATLVSSQLMGNGVHNTEWRGQTTVAFFDANGDGYADPGKYAFIVEVRDRAGNVTQRKWGGTVWIQNNVLQLIQPETIGINPDPLNFSPNTTTGNSPNTTTKFWFKVKLGISPAAPADPERIEAMALPDDFRWLEGVVKKVGTYTVKVYDSTGNWIRTIEKDSPMYSATDTFVIWDGKTGTGPDKLTPDVYVADGDYKLVADIKDFSGNPAYGNLLERWVKADSTRPTITFGGQAADVWYIPDNAITIAPTDNLTYKGYKWNWDSWPSADPSGYNPSTSGTTNHPAQGKRTLYLRIWDEAGNRWDESREYWRDYTAPNINVSPFNYEFNPYPSNSLNLNFTVSDGNGCGIKSVNAAIKWGGLTIRNYGNLGQGGDYPISWNGKNDAGHFVNDGNYSLEIVAVDNLNQSRTYSSAIRLWDEQKIVDTLGESRTPRIGISGSNVHIAWIELESGEWKLYYKKSTDNGTNWGSNIKLGDRAWYENGHSSIVVNGDNVHIVRTRWSPEYYANLYYIKSTNNGESWGTEKKIFSYAENGSAIAVNGSNVFVVWSWNRGVYYSHSTDNGETWPLVTWPGGSYCLVDGVADRYNPSISVSGSNVHVVWGESRGGIWNIYYRRSTDTATTWVSEQQLASNLPSWIKPVIKSSGNTVYLIYNKNDGLYLKRSTDNGSTWGSEIRLSTAPVGSIGGVVADGDNLRVTWTEYRDSNWRVFYKISTNQGLTWSPDVRLPFRYFASFASDITINDNIVYAVWENRDDYDIYFQKIPIGFAPIEGTPTALKVREGTTQALTKPLLLEPKDGSTITTTIRPTFKWQGVPGITDYKVQLNKDFDAFASPTRILSKTVTQTESNQAIAYAIHEFDYGLVAGQWYWRVLASPGTTLEAASDSWSFTVDPALSITGITNYPNPFNPNRERTSIRYRLGRDADEVKIRIYDITGALVTELEGSTQGESVNIWSKYNDIYWDGRNGRGDMIMNGIYPFEVVARQGDRSVSGRGKIAVLK